MDPFFGAELPPIGNGAQDDFFPHGDGKVFDVPTGEVMAFMAAVVAFFPGAGLDGATLAKQADPVRQAAVAFEVIDGNPIEARDFFLVHGQEPLQKIVVVVPRGIVNTANTAVETATGQKLFFNFHESAPFPRNLAGMYFIIIMLGLFQ